MACDEIRARVKFSCFVYRVRFFLLIARSSIVSGHEWLMILLEEKSQEFITLKTPYILESNPHPFLQFQRAKKSDAD